MSDPVAIARSWLGTPYVHQASQKGAGTDCLGLIRGIWRELYGSEPIVPPPYSADWDEVQGAEVLWQAAKQHLRPTDDIWVEGQVMLFRMRTHSVAKHLGILVGPPNAHTFIHAFAKHGVVESSLSTPWRRRVVARFNFKEA